VTKRTASLFVAMLVASLGILLASGCQTGGSKDVPPPPPPPPGDKVAPGDPNTNPAAAKPAPPTEEQAVGQAPASPVAVSPSVPAAEQRTASTVQAAKPKPAKPASNRHRRKRSRLARFFKHVLGGR